MKALLILVLIATVGCGAPWHLQQAKKHLLKAEQLGADVSRDTTYKKMTFEFKGAKTSFNLGPTILHRKDGVENRVILKDTVIYKDRIKTEIKNNTVYVECPDEKPSVDVPVTVNTKIKAGYTKWQYGSAIVGGILFGLIVGFLVGKIIKVGI